jgi:arylformamidase
MSGAWIDISMPLHPGMVRWPGDPAFGITRTADLARGDLCTVSQLALGAHSGTHLDAPAHFIRDGAAMDALPFDAVIGPVRVVEIHDPVSIQAAELNGHALLPGERVLFKTRNSQGACRSPDFVEDYVYVARDAAAHLVERRVRTVGIDYLSVGGFRRDGIKTHRTLLAAGVWIIEGLDLAEVAPGNYEMICLPLRVLGAEGAPARAVLRAQ